MRKKSKPADTLNALLGITEKVNEVQTRSTGNVVGVSEKEIQEFREAQGLLYFLQAPALFTPKVCDHCGEPFLVSRKYVAACSYRCIQKSLEAIGIKWNKGNDLETLAQDPQVFNGNEPIWIRNPYLTQALAILQTLLENSESKDLPSEDSQPESAPAESSSTVTSTTPVVPSEESSSSVVPTATGQSTNSGVGTTSSRGRKQRRIIAFE